MNEHLAHVQQRKTRRHLVVDDSEPNRRVMRMYLEAAGLTVDAVPSGTAALDAMAAAGGADAYDAV